MVKSYSREGKHRDIKNVGNMHGKHMEFENLKKEIQYQADSCRKNYCVTLMKWCLKFKILQFYCRNSQGKLRLHKENTGKTKGILFSMMGGNHGHSYVF